MEAFTERVLTVLYKELVAGQLTLLGRGSARDAEVCVDENLGAVGRKRVSIEIGSGRVDRIETGVAHPFVILVRRWTEFSPKAKMRW